MHRAAVSLRNTARKGKPDAESRFPAARLVGTAKAVEKSLRVIGQSALIAVARAQHYTPLRLFKTEVYGRVGRRILYGVIQKNARKLAHGIFVAAEHNVLVNRNIQLVTF